MKPGDEIKQPFMVMDVDLVKTLTANGFPNPNDAASNPAVKLVVSASPT